MSEAERRLLTREAGCASTRRLDTKEFEFLHLATIAQGGFQFELAVEMVLDHVLVAPGYEHDMFNARRARLVHHMLDDRSIDDRQHLFRHGAGGREKAGAEAGDGEDSLANALHVTKIPVGWPVIICPGRMADAMSHCVA
jgi:hypothetical protein